MKALKHVSVIVAVWFLCYLLVAFAMNTFYISQWYEGARFFVVFVVLFAAVSVAPIIWIGG